jgi:hypothetical protein
MGAALLRRIRVAILAALVAAIMVPSAGACPLPQPPYPGDDASQVQVAQWMAGGAISAGLPGELPVMGALVASGLKNLSYGDRDEVGVFGMRTGIWNRGKYAGFPDHPELQLQWFIDQAILARQQRIDAGQADPLPNQNLWGEWVADVLRPAEQFRGRYQLQLETARALIGPPCDAAGAPAPPTADTPVVDVPAPDTVPPALRVASAATQRALRRGAVLVAATCPGEPCAASATATVRVLGQPRRLSARTRALAAGETTTLRLVLDARTRTLVRRALRARRAVTARVRVTVADGAANRAIGDRLVRITG